MKTYAGWKLVLHALLFNSLIAAASAQDAPLYWDPSGGGLASGSWSGSNWTSDSSGTSTSEQWIPNSDAVFSAGNVGAAPISVSVSGAPSLQNLTVSAGSVTLSGGALTLTPSYQQQITGRPAGTAFFLNGTRFDGEANGVLLMARGEFKGGVGKMLNKEWFAHNAEQWVADARRWVTSARGVPIEYHVADERLAEALRALYNNNGITGIKVIFTPFK